MPRKGFKKPASRACDVCKKIFRDSSTCKRHMKIHMHPNEIPLNFPCMSCDRQFASLNGLQKHMTITHKVSRTCAVCGEHFQTLAGLRTHHTNNHFYQMKPSLKSLKPLLPLCHVCGLFANDLMNSMQCTLCKVTLLSETELIGNPNAIQNAMQSLPVLSAQSLILIPMEQTNVPVSPQSLSFPEVLPILIPIEQTNVPVHPNDLDLINEQTNVSPDLNDLDLINELINDDM